MGNLCGGKSQPKKYEYQDKQATPLVKEEEKPVEAKPEPETVKAVIEKPKEIPKKKKLNKADFQFVKRDGEFLFKKPGDINGIDFQIKDLKNCTVILLDHIAQIQVWRCENCTFYIGPIKTSIFIHDSKDCNFTLSCSQFRCRGLEDSTLNIFTPNDPIIESSKGLKFLPYNFKYPLLHEHAEKATLLGDFTDEIGLVQTKINKWSQVHDFTPSEEKNYEVLGVEDFVIVHVSDVADLLNVEIEQLEPTSNPDFLFELPVAFGGTITSEMYDRQASQGHLGMSTFKAGTSQAAAESYVQVKESLPSTNDI